MTGPPLSDLSSLSLQPKKRGPFHLVPVIARPTLGAVTVWPFQAKPVSHHRHRCDCLGDARVRTRQSAMPISWCRYCGLAENQAFCLPRSAAGTK